MITDTLNVPTLNQCTDLFIWQKDSNLKFIDLNQSAASAFGFKNPDSAKGKSDYDIPSKLSKFADVFREHDNWVMKNGKKLKLLEIQPCSNDEWKILHVVKEPYVENNEIVGVLGYSLDVTSAYLKLDHILMGDRKEINPGSFSRPEMEFLTLRESECLFFLLRKCTAKEIASILNLSYRTIEHYIEILKIKFKCETKSELIRIATLHGYSNIIPPRIMQKQLSIIIE